MKRFAIDISGALAGVRKAALAIERYADYRMPTRPSDRRTVRIAGRAKHWYVGRDEQLHLAEGESPWN